MTANRMHEWGDGRHTIGFEQADAPVTNTLQVHAGLTDGNVDVSFRSTWAQAGASHSTDGALVLSRADAEALARVLAPRESRGAALLVLDAVCALLPADPVYMDPPDGGNVSVLELLARMAEDAAKWRAHLAGARRALPITDETAMGYRPPCCDRGADTGCCTNGCSADRELTAMGVTVTP